MFHLLNLAQEQRAFLLITARAAPASWPIGLPDLASRLRALPVVTLAAPDDAMLRAVLVKLFADRQLAVDDGLISFLMVRIERSFAAARAVRRGTRSRGAAPATSGHPGARGRNPGFRRPLTPASATLCQGKSLVSPVVS